MTNPEKILNIYEKEAQMKMRNPRRISEFVVSFYKLTFTTVVL